jgi:hypothetical protein
MPGQSRAALATEILLVSVGCVAYTVCSVVEVAAAWRLLTEASKHTSGQDGRT